MRKRTLELIMAVIMLTIICILAIHNKYITTVNTDTSDNIIVVLDAGHGGKDPGKVAKNNVLEKDLNLQIALKLKELLEDEEICVIMTREEDVGLYNESDSNKKSSDMKKRCKLINESNAVLAVSIHQNSYPSADVKGAQAFYYSQSGEGKILAETIQESIISTVDKTNNRKAKSNNNYYMLTNTQCPSVIVECGFLSNTEETALLVTEEYQEKIAKAIKNGILEYLDKK